MGRIDEDHEARRSVEAELDGALSFAWRRGGFVLVTSHRRENFPDGLARICTAIDNLAERFPAMQWVFPVHPNPGVRDVVRAGIGQRDTIHLLDPLDYSAFLHLLRHCHCVLTDSGGLQEEGSVLGKPVLVVREVTERPEAIAAGGLRLVGTDTAAIVSSMAELLDDRHSYDAMAHAPNPFGDGHAEERIADYLEQALFSNWAAH